MTDTESAGPSGPAPARVLGVDPSLRSTGVASSLGWTTTIRPRTRALSRLRDIVTRATEYAGDGYRLAVIEGPAYRTGAQRGHDELSALRWMLRDRLDRSRFAVAIAPPQSVKLWATGAGDATKAQVSIAMRLPGREDEADALALARLGAAWLDGEPLTERQQRAVDGVTWPEEVRVDDH